MTKNKFLFNFAASYSGGGFKRLYAYAQWFNEHGGAWFIIHSNCCSLVTEFTNNRFFIVKQFKLQRLFNDCGYLEQVKTELPMPDIYFSYGIPIYHKFGRINWFHLSNVLPLDSSNIPLSCFDRVKLNYLGKKIKGNYKNTDIISAESDFSLNLIDPQHPVHLFLSVNGSDDEIKQHRSVVIEKKDDIAVVLGTYGYKALEDSYSVFNMLREHNKHLKLVIIGDEQRIPKCIKKNKESVIITGSISRALVVEYLRKSKYYISTTYIENSYNAAAEGVFLADESFISDIKPHRELILGMPCKEISIPKMDRAVLHLKRKELSPENLKSWNTVIREMLGFASSIGH